MMLLRKKFGFGISLTPPPAPDGVFGIFKTTGAGTSVYSYNTDTSASGLSMSTTSDRPIALGNAAAGIFFLSGTVGVSAKYNYAAGTVTNNAPTVGVSLGSGSASASNSVFGIISPNTTGASPMRKYLFATDTIAASTSATVAQNSGCGVSGVNYAMFSMGGSGSGSNVTNKYAYANDAVTVGAVMSGLSKSGGAAGNQTRAYFVLGSATAVSATSTYSFAGEQFTAGTSAAFLANYGLVATGNAEKGIYSYRGSTQSGTTPTDRTLKCVYASGIFSTGTTLTANTESSSNAATTNGNSGII